MATPSSAGKHVCTHCKTVSAADIVMNVTKAWDQRQGVAWVLLAIHIAVALGLQLLHPSRGKNTRMASTQQSVGTAARKMHLIVLRRSVEERCPHEGTNKRFRHFVAKTRAAPKVVVQRVIGGVQSSWAPAARGRSVLAAHAYACIHRAQDTQQRGSVNMRKSWTCAECQACAWLRRALWRQPCRRELVCTVCETGCAVSRRSPNVCPALHVRLARGGA
jgi:hypothetical protein